MIALTCPGCGRTLRVKDDLAGKKIRCPRCPQVIAVPPAVAAATPTPVGASVGASPDRPTDDVNFPPAAGTLPDAPVPLSDSAAGTLSHDGANATVDGPEPHEPPARPDRELTEFLAPAEAPGELGRLGGYRVLEVLGRGGMGVVFRAEDPKLQRQVALKAMLPGLAVSQTARERFLREARTAAAVEHDHVVVIHQVGEDRGVPFLAMPLLRGESLDARLNREGRLPVAEVLRIGRESALGLAAAHEQGLVHRDVKPANLWLEEKTGRVKVLDFGLARAAKEEGQLTQPGAVVGTPAYMAPEQANGAAVDARSDLFSLGCVLYRAATGEAPFAGKDALSTLLAVARDEPAAPSAVNPAVPPGLSDLTLRLLSKDPCGRPASAHEVIQALLAVGAPLAAASTPGVSGTATPSPPTIALSATGAAVRIQSSPDAGKRRAWIVAAVAAGFLATAMAATVVIIIRDKNGAKIAELNVPPGGKAEIVDDAPVGKPAVASKPPTDDAFVQQAAALAAEKQVEAVAANLKELNPGFDGKVTPTIENGVVTGLQLTAVTDVSPIRALPDLKSLICTGGEKGRLSDLSPLKDIKLTHLECWNTAVSDLSPLKNMKLQFLNCAMTSVSDLSPLQGMPLTCLDCTMTSVSDLSPLQGMPLTTLQCQNTPVSKLSPLKGMKLTALNCGYTKVSDLSPLKGMPLTQLEYGDTPVSDLSPLKGMNLTILNGFSTPVSDLSPLMGMNLTYLDCSNTQVPDLSPLKGMPLMHMVLAGTPVSDLSPLKGMPLTYLDCKGTKMFDLSPLKGMPLKELRCDVRPERDADLLRSLKTLETINGKPVEAFWKDAEEKKQ